VRWLEEFLQDLRYGFRLLRKNPAFSVVVVLALALGLGANMALFSLFNTVLLGALPVQHPEQLVVLSTVNENSDSITSFSYPMYRELRDKNAVFSGMIAQAGVEMNASYAGESEKARGGLVTGNYFETLGVQPWRGRLFSQADDRIPGAHPVAVLSYEYWQRRFGGDRGIVGGKLILNNRADDGRRHHTSRLLWDRSLRGHRHSRSYDDGHGLPAFPGESPAKLRPPMDGGVRASQTKRFHRPGRGRLGCALSSDS